MADRLSKALALGRWIPPRCPDPTRTQGSVSLILPGGNARFSGKVILHLHGEPGGPTSITDRARFVLTIFYIDITFLSGRTVTG